MKRKILHSIFLFFLILVTNSLYPQTLNLPARQPNAPTGSQFVNIITNLSLTAREDTILSHVLKGNVPDFIRNLKPITVTATLSSISYTLTYLVTPDYLAIGTNVDYFLCPMTPILAQKIADRIGCTLPTRKMVGEIWNAATVKLAPSSIPPSAQMTTVPIFNQHNTTVFNQRSAVLAQHPLGELVSGDKKDVVISNKIYGYPSPKRVVIYGWYQLNGLPIQPLYNGHEETYADYSHGIRMVQMIATLNGNPVRIDDLCKSATLYSLVSDENIIAVPRYPVALPPSAIAINTPVWATYNFNTTFIDSTFTGVSGKYYLVSDFDGTEWRANTNNGFNFDNFNNLDTANHKIISGTWTSSSGVLNQSDDVSSNTNLYSPLHQTDSGSFLYRWKMNIGVTGTNRRAGLHFFCDNATLANRHNSYMVYYRADNDKVQIYRCSNDSILLKTDDAATINAGTWYDCKVIYTPTFGKITAFLNDVKVSEWTDSAAFQSGNFISYRTGNCTAAFDSMMVYKSRTSSQIVSVGDISNDVRFSNSSPSIPACKIYSMVHDNAYTFMKALNTVNIDFTAPQPIDQVIDSLYNDVDTAFSLNSLSAHWSAASDVNSGLSRYWYAVGTSPNDSDIVGWTDNGLDTSVTVPGLALNSGVHYYFSVKAQNGAGLKGTAVFSDGVFIYTNIILPTASFTISDSVVCAESAVAYSNTSVNANSYQWIFDGGTPNISTLQNPLITYNTGGIFTVKLKVYGSHGQDSILKTSLIHVLETPAKPDRPSGSEQLCFNSANSVYKINSVANTISYHWMLFPTNAGLLVNSDTSAIVDWNNNFFGDAYLFVKAVNACGEGISSDTIIIRIEPLVGNAQLILGATQLCENSIYSSYSTFSIANASSYTWILNPTNAGLIVNTDTSAIINWNHTFSGTAQLTVQGANNCGTGAISAPLIINVNALPAASSKPSGNTNMCINSGSIEYFTNTISNAVQYEWSLIPTNAGIVNGIDTSCTISWSNSFVGNAQLSVRGLNQCGYGNSSAMLDITVKSLPVTPSLPTGLSMLCQKTYSSIYSLQNYNLQNIYHWNITPASAASTVTVDSLVIIYWNPTFFGSAELSVFAENNCGISSTSDTLQITVNALPIASFNVSDTLLEMPNSTVVFTNQSLHATNYLWNFGDGNTATTTDASHSYTQSGLYTIMLFAQNNFCGSDTIQKLNLIHISDPVGISLSQENENLLVFPNPISNAFYVYFNEVPEDNAIVEITDPSGGIVFSRQINLLHNLPVKMKLDIDRRAISAGFYLIIIKFSQKCYTRKVLIH